ncbi:hypothetical protein LTR78_001235 [Recurvomyces mirabilis]|uniref:DUF1740-domain-containing protein n=1 Tax=Recurvomyces mirabilis TaxID=574656 RepID=A0AAE1C5H7_9PEZI|nr:hypothetical protein LTR78_001235 [Recurvomyces mirabilis]KAK5161211.1 hypothetical protein LTS14_001007 [Recurvomyces mirabilis]
MSDSVPKFGSFRPKSKAPEPGSLKASIVEFDSDPYDADVRRRHTGRVQRKRAGDNREDLTYRDPEFRALESSKTSRRHRDYERRHGDDDKDALSSRASRITAADELAESDDYFVDRRGDTKNVEYGTLHRYSVPQYHRAGYGRLLGLSSVKIDRDESTDKHIVLSRPASNRNEQNRSLLSTHRSTTHKEKHYRVVLPETSTKPLDASADYMHLCATASRKRKRGDHDGDDRYSSRLDVDYRSIEGKAKSEQQPQDEDLLEDTDSDDVAEGHVASEARRRNAVLTKATKERPTDTKVWLALINYQAQLIRSHVPIDRYTHAEKRALADIRLSIYDQALKQVPAGSAESEDLVLGMLEQGTILWEGSKLASRWGEVLAQNAGSMRLWTKYLDFVQTDHNSFRFEICKATYLNCFTVLGKARKSTANAELEAVSEVQVYVLLRYTIFLRDAGYDELAYAIWQILLEYHSFKPSGMDCVEQALEQLEEFWDSDAPRIGETGAQGWQCSFGSNIKRAKAVSPRNGSHVTATSVLSRLLEGEQDTLDELQLPATNDDDEIIDDPYCYVMFADIREIVEQLNGPLPTYMLIRAFFAFLRLPTVATSDGDSSWQTDQFICSPGVDHSLAVQRLEMTTTELFTTAFDGCEKHSPSQVLFVDRAISLLISAKPDDECLAEYYLAFKLALMPYEAVKAAKKLLKARPSSLRLYNAYALVEAKRGRIEKAVEVWSTALKMSASFQDSEQDNSVLLWHSWLHTLINRDSKDAAVVQVILAMCDNDADRARRISDSSAEVSASQRIKAKQLLEAAFERMVYKSQLDLAAMFADCHMWFEYFAVDHSLDHALEIRKQYTVRLKRHVSYARAAEEVLLQSHAHLIQYHLDHHRPYKPAALRAEVADGLAAFPNNSYLIKLYQCLSASTRIDDHIRASLHHDLVTGPEATIVGWSHAIDQELRHYRDGEATGSTQNSVRSIFSRALATPESRVRHSVLLWKSWLQFEMSVATPSSDSQRTKGLARAKQVFLDGLRALPWSKAWTFEGLTVFLKEGGMTDNEMRMVIEVVRERELRVRMSVDELDEEAVAA